MDAPPIYNCLKNISDVVARDVDHVPHSALKPLLSQLSALANESFGNENLDIIRMCAETVVMLEPQLKVVKELNVLKNIVAIALFVCASFLSEQTTSDHIHSVVKVYRARLACMPDYSILVAVTTETLDLPTVLADGTPVKQVNLSERASVVPSVPNQSENDIPAAGSRTAVTAVVNKLYPQMLMHSNVFALTSVYIRGAWHILVGVTGKGLIPNGDALLPKFVDGFRLVVTEYRFIPLMSRQAWTDENPQPQLGGAIAPASALHRMGTIGPAVQLEDGRGRFFTSAHTFKGCKVGDRVVLPGMMARALNAVWKSGGGRNPMQVFQRWIRLRGSAAHAVQAAAEAFPQWMKTAEQDPPKEFGVLAWMNKDLDVAAVLLDEEYVLSTCALNWSDTLPPDDSADLSVVLTPETSWHSEALQRRLLEGGIPSVGYGASSAIITGFSDLLVKHVKGMELITLENCNCESGDSGSTIWSRCEGGEAKVLGMLGWRGEWTFAAENSIVTVGYVIPAWVLNNLIDVAFPLL